MFTKNADRTPCKLMSFTKYQGGRFNLDSPLDDLRDAYVHFNPELRAGAP